MAKPRDITKQRFGRLVAIKRVGFDKHRHALWLCECDCGNETIATLGALTRKDHKRTQSCGCLFHDAMVAYNKANKVTHGLHGTRIHTVWKDMIYRCEKPSTTNYENYGGRGIKVCDEWHDLKKFAKWAYGSGYDDTAKKGDCTIERIDVNGDYEPKNCTWVNMFEQNANRRNTFKVDVNGESVPLMKAVKEVGVQYKLVYERIKRHGETFDEAVRQVQTTDGGTTPQ